MEPSFSQKKLTIPLDLVFFPTNLKINEHISQFCTDVKHSWLALQVSRFAQLRIIVLTILKAFKVKHNYLTDTVSFPVIHMDS